MAAGPTDFLDPLARHSLSPRELQDVRAIENAGSPFLALREPGHALGLFVLEPGACITVGRRAETDLPLLWDNEVSALHAELERRGGEWTIQDDGLSRNGTFVNGRRISGRHRLRNGDRIRVGRTVLAYRSPGQAGEGETVPAIESPLRAPLTESQRRVLTALCRPYHDAGTFAAPASNKQIAQELFLSVDAVKLQLRTLFARFELSDLPQNQKRSRLAECALQLGVVTERDLAED